MPRGSAAAAPASTVSVFCKGGLRLVVHVQDDAFGVAHCDRAVHFLGPVRDDVIHIHKDFIVEVRLHKRSDLTQTTLDSPDYAYGLSGNTDSLRQIRRCRKLHYLPALSHG